MIITDSGKQSLINRRKILCGDEELLDTRRNLLHGFPFTRINPDSIDTLRIEAVEIFIGRQKGRPTGLCASGNPEIILTQDSAMGLSYTMNFGIRIQNIGVVDIDHNQFPLELLQHAPLRNAPTMFHCQSMELSNCYDADQWTEWGGADSVMPFDVVT
jgi:hypothetical protein